MTSLGSKNGYTRLPTVDPDLVVEGSGATGGYGGMQYGPHRDLDTAAGHELNSSTRGSKKSSLNHRPGLFHMFGDRGKYAANHISAAIASRSESEHEAERIELTEMRPKRPKLRRGRIKSSGKSPKGAKSKQPRFKFNIVEEPIQPGDTVQRIALRYSCPVSHNTDSFYLVSTFIVTCLLTYLMHTHSPWPAEI